MDMQSSVLEVAKIQSFYRVQNLKTLKNDPTWKDFIDAGKKHTSKLCDNIMEDDDDLVDSLDNTWGNVKRPKPKPMHCYGKGKPRVPLSQVPDFSNIEEFERNLMLLEEASTTQVALGRGRGRGRGRGASHHSSRSIYAPEVNIQAIQAETKRAMGNWSLSNPEFGGIRPPKSKPNTESDLYRSYMCSTSSLPNENGHNHTLSASTKNKQSVSPHLAQTPIPPPCDVVAPATTTIPPPAAVNKASSCSAVVDSISSSSSESSKSLPPLKLSDAHDVTSTNINVDNTPPASHSNWNKIASSDDLKNDFFVSDSLQSSLTPSTYVSSTSLPDYCQGYASSTKATPSNRSSSSSLFSSSSRAITSSSSRESGIGKTTTTNNCSNNTTSSSGATFVPNIRESVSSSNNSQDDEYEEAVPYRSPPRPNASSTRSANWDPFAVNRNAPTAWDKNTEFPVLGQESTSSAKPQMKPKTTPMTFRAAAEESLGLLRPVSNCDEAIVSQSSSDEEEDDDDDDDDDRKVAFLSFITDTIAKDKPDVLVLKNIPLEIKDRDLISVMKDYGGEVKKINLVQSGETQVAELSVQGVDGAWVAEILNNTTPFGGSVPITCELLQETL